MPEPSLSQPAYYNTEPILYFGFLSYSFLTKVCPGICFCSLTRVTAGGDFGFALSKTTRLVILPRNNTTNSMSSYPNITSSRIITNNRVAVTDGMIYAAGAFMQMGIIS